jgi:hypothetical protein
MQQIRRGPNGVCLTDSSPREYSYHSGLIHLKKRPNTTCCVPRGQYSKDPGDKKYRSCGRAQRPGALVHLRPTAGNTKYRNWVPMLFSVAREFSLRFLR